MNLARMLRHFGATRARVRKAFPPATLDKLEQAIGVAEGAHSGEIRFAVEADLHLEALLLGHTPRERAIEVFSLLRVWDTAANNGLLIYLLFADRSVEIVADRGFNGLVTVDEWAAVCRILETEFRSGRFEAGALAGIAAAGRLVARHFPEQGARNDLPDRPVLL
jgi:TLP18.3/Psb32/MOLO-1 phosphatase superfamily protein